MSFSEFQTADRRLVILKGLEPAAQYRANSYLLLRWCERMGHVVSADRLTSDLAWLEEQGLVKLQHEGEVTTATLSQRGLDVATGRTTCPGVQRPAPGG